MRFKTYIGSHTELSQLMHEARQELGPEAVIKTEYFTEGGFFGLGSRKMVKVTAGVEDQAGESPFSVPRLTSAHSSNGHATPAPAPVAAPVASPQPMAQHETRPEPAHPFSPPPPPEPTPLADAPLSLFPEPEPTPVAAESSDVMQTVLTELRALRNEIEGIKSSGAAMLPGPQAHWSHYCTEAYRTLVDRELSPALAHDIVTQVTDRLTPEEQNDYETVVRTIADLIVAHCVATPVASETIPVTPRVVMLIGPTGVGKTTTLAKLAASYNLLEELTVALITADTFRIAAIDQLRTFAQIINLDLEVVFEPAEFTRAIELHGHQDLILVDTAGRSPRDETRLAELKRFLEVDYPVETMLVLAATTKGPDLRLILDRFGALGLDGLIFTKLDETTALGPLVELLWETHLPLRFLTNGQNVPDDIIRGDQETLTRRLVLSLFRGLV